MQYEWCPYKNWKCRHEDTYTWKTPCKDEGRNWNEMCVSGESSTVFSKLPEARGKARDRIIPTDLRKNQCCLFLGSLTSRTIGKYKSVVRTAKLGIIC